MEMKNESLLTRDEMIRLIKDWRDKEIHISVVLATLLEGIAVATVYSKDIPPAAFDEFVNNSISWKLCNDIKAFILQYKAIKYLSVNNEDTKTIY